MPKPKGYVDAQYLQMAARLMQPFKERTYHLMQIQPGQRVLDVGCGPGTDTLPLARLVGPMGWVVGVDHDPAMVRQAERLAASAGLNTWVKHLQADVRTGLPCPSGTFDSCRS
jgi:ubiquinone/menaquinone biosynthesis C-methylase UbiE